jgi:hypothetical protein
MDLFHVCTSDEMVYCHLHPSGVNVVENTLVDELVGESNEELLMAWIVLVAGLISLSAPIGVQTLPLLF